MADQFYVQELEKCIQRLQLELKKNNIECDKLSIPQTLQYIDGLPLFILEKIEIFSPQPQYEILGAAFEKVVVLPGQEKYLGQWKNKLMNGRGQLYNQQKQIFYQGYWKENAFVFGQIIGIDFYYEGTAQKGEPFQGLMCHTNGLICKGEFLNWKLNGKGRIKNQNTSEEYVGECFQGKYQGQGKLTTTEFCYEGEFQDGQITGKGQKVYHSGDKKQWKEFGQFKNGLLDGQGQEIKSSTDYYDGMFKQGVKHGKGFRQLDDTKYYGEFKNGFLDGQAEVTTGPRKYFSEFKEGKEDVKSKILIN